MADEPLYSSQSSSYEQHKILDDQENLASSPIVHNHKPKKPPTVTPKRFTKFFTPRSSLSSRRGRQSKAGRQLRDITKNGANRNRHPAALRRLEDEELGVDALSERPSKRRKHSFNVGSSPPQSSPLKRVHVTDNVHVLEDVPSSPAISDEDDFAHLLEDLKPFPKPVKQLRQTNSSAGILQRSFGGFDALSRGRRKADHCVEWRAETENFASTPNDIHYFTGTAIPFCTASCRTNSLIAIGEEEGRVRLVDSSPMSNFSVPHVEFRPHHNAIMDINFSSDDYMLATASGDQTARIIDMHTQKTMSILSGHTSSVKQVRFQPKDDNIITTSSRDGTVQVWDLRCGGRGSIATLRSAFARNVDDGGVQPTVQYSKHRLNVAPAYRPTTPAATGDSGVSITSIQHLPNGREHLLVTASEYNSSVKLWDLRNASRRSLATPVSTTLLPPSHLRTRNYGVNSMSWSTDGARLYTACRDGAVYAYSTNHLLLGCAPELANSTHNSRTARSTKPGIAPLHAYRHPSLRMGSFYIKSSIRHAKGDKGEMLAVGSSDNCAVLFPTDEGHLPERERAGMDEDDEEDGLPSVPMLDPKKNDKAGHISSYEQGTALTRGHSKEVTSLTWTHDGELVTVSDDFTARCWREDGAKARELRQCGEGGGQRWRCGWAEVGGGWDEDDG
ncbi:uncharacterized protein LTR77_007415 [Saxophila tyrrhenica]|uniref:WD40 repeat-like protein n=1 Tax=Saxophila tyrrhenica TaxID=1690608 RepID=A0AAV9P4Q2_9PEZI|nr:hypothetical protein LTR77_007415 [Saxophila tyrrhenica]